MTADPVTPGPDAPMPREVVEHAIEAGRAESMASAGSWYRRDKQTEAEILAAISHPAFAPWFLRRLAGQEPYRWVRVSHELLPQLGEWSRPVEVRVESVDGIEIKLVFRHALNAVAPASAPDAQEGGKE